MKPSLTLLTVLLLAPLADLSAADSPNKNDTAPGKPTATAAKAVFQYTTTNFELTVQAVRAIAAAPGWLAGLTDDDLKGRVQRMKTALAAHQPRHDYERALQLQLAVAMPELVPQQVRDGAIAMLWKHHHLHRHGPRPARAGAVRGDA